MPAYTSRRYSWPGKKVPRDLVDREKSGDAPGGTFSPDAATTKGTFLIIALRMREANPQGNGCDFVNVPESCNQRDDRDNYTL